MIDIATEIGERIRQARKQQSMTQISLSKKLYINKNAVCDYETGKRCPNVYMLYKIAEVLGVKVADLLPEEMR